MYVFGDGTHTSVKHRLIEEGLKREGTKGRDRHVINNIMDTQLLDAVQLRLSQREAILANSDFFSRSLAVLEDVGFNHIHCLALGSPTKEFQALYQLAFLKLLVKKFATAQVLVYDPVFDENDAHLLESVLGYRIADVSKDDDASATLYYMPHAPRSVTDKFIATIQPRWILGNDVTVTMGTLGKARFLAEYPTLATLVHVAVKDEKKTVLSDQDGKEAGKTGTSEEETLHKEKTTDHDRGTSADGFRVAGRRRKRKNVYVEPVLEYDVDLAYFELVVVKRLEGSASEAWKDSFSDLALNIIVGKT